MSKKCSDSAIGALRHAYELGALSVEDIEKFEIHLLECEACYEEVVQFETAATLMRTDAEVRREVREAIDGTKRQTSLVRDLLRYLWPETPLVLKPAVSFFVMALLIYPAYLGMRGDGDTGLREIQSVSLIPSRSGATASFQVSSDQDGLVTFVFPGAVVGKMYHLVVETSEGSEIMSIDNFSGFDEYETGRIVIPLGRLDEGTYRLVIADEHGVVPYREQVYVFEVSR